MSKRYMTKYTHSINVNIVHIDGTSPAHLKIHIESIHQGIRYHCEQCNFKTAQKGYLKIHIKMVHKGF